MTTSESAAPVDEAGDERRGPQSILSAYGVSKSFGGVQAVAGVSLSIQAGEVLGLIGPNGSGKSTLLDLLAGVQQSDAGRIELHGADVTFRRAPARAKRGLARLFQLSRVYASLTVEENLRVVRGRNGHPSENLMDEILEVVGLAPHRRKYAGELSYGQQRLVDIGRALAMSPDVLLLDEPTAGVHVNLIENIAGLIRELRMRNSSLGILIVEHNVSFVRSLCDRLLAMDDGRLIAEGSVEDVLADEKVVTAYYGG